MFIPSLQAYIDVQKLYPNVGSIEKWVRNYDKIIIKARNLKKHSFVRCILEYIDEIVDEREFTYFIVKKACIDIFCFILKVKEQHMHYY